MSEITFKAAGPNWGRVTIGVVPILRDGAPLKVGDIAADDVVVIEWPDPGEPAQFVKIERHIHRSRGWRRHLRAAKAAKRRAHR